MPGTGLPVTLADMQATLTRWLMEDLDPDQLTDAINDAIDDVFNQCCLFNLSLFLQGPVSNLVFAPAVGGTPATERVLLVSIADPTINPAVFAGPGGTLAMRSLDTAYTIVTDSGTETKISPVVTQVVPGSQLLSCSPPSYALATPAVSGALGWNIYVGVTPVPPVVGRLAKQNDDPISFDDTWQEPPTGIVQNPQLPGPPASNTTADDIAYIKHMEIQTPDGIYQPWNQGDIDSAMFRQMARTISSASPYQNYVWDLVNRRTVELRPAAGTNLAPRYWYVQRPRQLRYPGSRIPYLDIIGMDCYIRKAALTDLTLSIHEYQASVAWGKKAQEDLTRILQSVNQCNWSKNTRVIPIMYV